MLAQEFINRLSALLQNLPPLERDKAIAYYVELISDKVESGMDEATVVADFGDINQLAQTILEENSCAYTQTTTKKNGYKTLIIVLLIIFSLPLFGLAMGVFGIAVGLAGAIFGISFALFATSAALAISGIVLFLSSFILIPTNPVFAMLQMGAGLILAGVSVFMLMGTYYLAKAFVKLVGLVFTKTKNTISKKRCTV